MPKKCPRIIVLLDIDGTIIPVTARRSTPSGAPEPEHSIPGAQYRYLGHDPLSPVDGFVARHAEEFLSWLAGDEAARLGVDAMFLSGHGDDSLLLNPVFGTDFPLLVTEAQRLELDARRVDPDWKLAAVIELLQETSDADDVVVWIEDEFPGGEAASRRRVRSAAGARCANRLVLVKTRTELAMQQSDCSRVKIMAGA